MARTGTEITGGGVSNPSYVIVKLLDPVGPEDAQNVARHLVDHVEFADVESATPAAYDGLHSVHPIIHRYRVVGSEASLTDGAST